MDPSLTRFPQTVEPGRTGRFVRVSSQDGEEVEATKRAATPGSALGRIGFGARRVLLGPPLRSSAIAIERMRKLVALPVLSADALSSVAYGPEAMLAILVLGGSSALGLAVPIAAVIAFLMLSVGLSYRQTIRAYPQGGGSYVAATENLGRLPGLIAAGGLMIDYVLTVAVSIAAGVAAITSAVPGLAPDAVPIGLLVIALLLAGNLRGVRQAGALFSAPTYMFIAAMLVLVVVGLVDAAGRGFSPTPPPHVPAIEGIGVLLVLRAFASGSTAMTGIEAISNAVPAFRPPEWRNARTTLTCMVALLILLFAGTIALIHLDGIAPSPDQTVLSQLGHRGFGNGALYVYLQVATALVLLLAANTAYNGFPRLVFLMARDFHAPRLFLRMGDRLAFSAGIVFLSIAAGVIFAAFGGHTNPLIPLFAVGVFLAFTLCQLGMVVHWWRRRDAHWQRSLAINAIGGFLSAIVFVIAAVTKFTDGAWVAVLGVLLVVLAAGRIRRHYDRVHEAVSLHPLADGDAHHRIVPSVSASDREGTAVGDHDVEAEESPEEVRHLALVAVAALDLPHLRALAYAASLRQPVLALHISPDDEEAKRFHGYWREWGEHLPLELIVSPYRAIVPPLIHYIEELHEQRPDLTLTIVLSELVVRHPWHQPLHSRVAPRLKKALRSRPGVVVTTVPFHLPF